MNELQAEVNRMKEDSELELLDLEEEEEGDVDAGKEDIEERWSHLLREEF